ncbi:transcriptional regulator [Stappia sp.]|uniref:transcriptional regulator n=1 Tax=Stappia sp. TaxID=1870903 RepID=UPI0032D92284
MVRLRPAALRFSLPVLVVAVFALVGASPLRAEDATLVMFEQKACEWCARWDAEIAPIYPKTEEGRRAPLRRVDIHNPMPQDLAWMRREVFTPSFALIVDGREVGRIRGYPGEDFFWGLLAEMIEKLDEDVDETSGAAPPPAAPG